MTWRSRHLEPDVSTIRAVIDELPAVLSAGQLVVLTSTTYPGTTSKLLPLALEAAGFTVGEDISLVLGPERVDPGNHATDLGGRLLDLMRATSGTEAAV